jgi:drug/metabolite transporter (DMT)-like permease
VIIAGLGGRKLILRRTEAKFLLASGVVSTIAVLALYTALLLAPVVLVSPIVNTSPLITLLVSYLFTSKIELINRKVVFGALAVVLGAVTVAVS